MVDIHPFKGYRYNLEHPGVEQKETVANLDDLVTQPYDKISDRMQDTYYQKSPYNFVRLILNRGDHQENLPEDKYEQAAAFLEQWREEGVFTQDEDPCLYVYSVEFTDGHGKRRERTGFFSLCELESYGEGSVHAHEKTMSGPKADRLRLLRATRTNLEPIFFLFGGGDENRIQNKLEEVKNTSPVAEARVGEDQHHRLWATRDTATIQRIQRLMREKQVVIADGHHRYETALNYFEELKQQDDPATETAGKRMAVFVSADDSGLFIYPSHRVLTGLEDFDGDRFIEALSRNFDVTRYPLNFDGEDAVAHQKEEFLEDVRFEGIDQHSFGVVLAGHDELLQISVGEEELPDGLFPSDKSDEWCQLDVNVLESLVLEHVLDITPAEIEEGKYLSYHRHEEEVFQKVRNGDAQLGFVMNPTDVQEVLDVAGQGEKMPQKSTDFYPKIPSGLVFSRIDDAESS